MVQAAEPTTDLTQNPPTDELESQTQEAAATADAGAEASGGAASTPTFDFDTDEGITAAIQANPRLAERFRKQQDDGFNAGRQNRDKELRLERGTEDVARAYQEHLAEKYGIELDEADRREAPLWVRANRDRERTELWATNANAVMDAFDVNERAQITAALEQVADMPEQTEQIARQVYDEAVKRQTVRRIASLTMEDIPQGSPLWQSMQAHVRAEFDKEQAAQAQEHEPQAEPPRVPVGNSAPPRTRAFYAQMSPEEIADLPEDEYRIAMGYGG